MHVDYRHSRQVHKIHPRLSVTGICQPVSPTLHTTVDVFNSTALCVFGERAPLCMFVLIILIYGIDYYLLVLIYED